MTTPTNDDSDDESTYASLSEYSYASDTEEGAKLYKKEPSFGYDSYRLRDGSIFTDDHLIEEDYYNENTSQCLLSKYGKPSIAPERAAELLPKSERGLRWHARVLPDDEPLPAKLQHETNPQEIKPRRPTLSVYAKDFFSSLVKTNEEEPRWIFSGVLNGWPALVLLEVMSITVLVQGSARINVRRGLHTEIKRVWSSNQEGAEGIPPTFPIKKNDDTSTAWISSLLKSKLPPVKHIIGEAKYTEVRVTLKAAEWTVNGWSRDSPGLVWYFNSKQRVMHGTKIIDALEKEKNVELCSKVHLFSHRYAMPHGKRESAKDKLTYHSAILLEWEHQQFTTVLELALLNGISGYRGKSNWCEDRDAEPASSLYKNMPRRMIAPWSLKLAEIRMYDVPAKNLDEFKIFVDEHTGPGRRFLDPHFTHSGDVRLTYRSRINLVQYMINYMGRDKRYSERFRNCQTFAADTYSFLAGKKNVKPFMALNKIEYVNRSHLFLYDYYMYDQWE